MKKTHLKELFATIKKSKVTFISILLFVAMSFVLFFGIQWTSDAIVNSANDYYKRAGFHDAEIQSTLGYTDDIENLKTIEGVDEVEGVYDTYAFLNKDENKFQVKISSITSVIDFPTLVKGKVPSEAGEIAFNNSFAEENNLSIGDKISFDEISTKLTVLGRLPIQNIEYTVTGFLDIAPYLSKYSDTFGISLPDSIRVNSLAYVHSSSFNEDAFLGYTRVLIKSNSLNDLNFFSKQYKNESDALVKRIKNYLNSDLITVAASTENNCHVILDSVQDIFTKLRFTMAGIFIILSLFISLFAISRLVHENKERIGAKKALGFTSREISLFYVHYVFLAVLVGSIIGVILARFAFEPVIVGVVNNIYHFDKRVYAFEFVVPILFLLGELLLQGLMAFLSARKIAKQKAISLLNNEVVSRSKKRFYEKTKLWKKTPLFTKSIINNFFNDKRRVLSTIFGVVCSASLLVCALTLNNNINGSFDKQYKDISHYDTILYFDPGQDNSEIKTTLDEKNIKHAEIMWSYIYLQTVGDRTRASYINVSDDPNFSELFTLKHLDGDEITLEDDVIYSSCSLHEFKETKSNTSIQFDDIYHKHHVCENYDFFEYYLINNLLVMNVETYEKEFNDTYTPNMIVFDRGEYSINDLNNLLKDKTGFLFLEDDYKTNAMSFETFSSVFSMLIALYFALATSMALLVLLNLLNMYIEEKKRELIVLMINGFSRKDADRYIAGDTIILSVLGMIVGILFGTLMSDFSLTSYLNETMYFKSGFDIIACLISTALTAALVAFTIFLALRRIKKFKLSDINK